MSVLQEHTWQMPGMGQAAKCGGITMVGMQVMSYGASAEAAATTAMFTRMLQHSLKDSNGLSQHPAATGMAPSIFCSRQCCTGPNTQVLFTDMHCTSSHVAQVIASSDVWIRQICMLLQLKIKALLTGAMHCTASLLSGCP